jgi:SAM-dependent methyltransferase
MDDPNIDPQLHRNALKGLARINRLTRNASLLYNRIRKLAQQSPQTRPLSILDVATGSGDQPFQWASWGIADKLRMEIIGVDISPLAVDQARLRCAALPIDRAPRFLVADVLDSASAIPSADIVTCSLFMHHLDDTQATQLLQRLASLARNRVLLVDLVRSRWNLLTVAIAARLLTRSPVVHRDAGLSIRAAFRKDELQTQAHIAAVKTLALRSCWPARFLIELEGQSTQ